MPERFKRSLIALSPIAEREDRMFAAQHLVWPQTEPNKVDSRTAAVICETAERLRSARSKDASRMLTFGAHTIKNGLAPVIQTLVKEGWLTHLATNGAGIIHDFELTVYGHTSEHVAENVARGRFGTWAETLIPINMAICAGAVDDRGYGESVGNALLLGRINIASAHKLCMEAAAQSIVSGRQARLLILAQHLRDLGLAEGYQWSIQRNKTYEGLQAFATATGIPFTAHVMFGHDIVFEAPHNCGALVGIAAEKDFLSFANSVSGLDGGVYMSLGSAVMSPMVFEKSVNMVNNVRIQQGKGPLSTHLMTIVDLAESHWDWSQGEPPEDNPDYYLRFMKSFSRMGGQMRYAGCDNRDFLLHLLRELRK